MAHRPSASYQCRRGSPRSFCIAALVRALFFQISRHFLPWAKPAVYCPRTVFRVRWSGRCGAETSVLSLFHRGCCLRSGQTAETSQSCKEFAAGGSGSCRASDRLYQIAPAPFDPHFFCHGNLNMINGAIVPVIHKQGVSKTQRQQVQHRFFTKIVVDTVNLALLEYSPT